MSTCPVSVPQGSEKIAGNSCKRPVFESRTFTMAKSELFERRHVLDLQILDEQVKHRGRRDSVRFVTDVANRADWARWLADDTDVRGLDDALKSWLEHLFKFLLELGHTDIAAGMLAVFIVVFGWR